MKLTIEIANPNEVEQLLHIFKAVNLESISVFMSPIDKKTDKINELLKTINRPIKPRLDLDELKKAKNYKGVNRKRFDRLVREINLTEPIEQLIAQLT
jgi:hypothetical protein